jgi:hypothetical protein
MVIGFCLLRRIESGTVATVEIRIICVLHEKDRDKAMCLHRTRSSLSSVIFFHNIKGESSPHATSDVMLMDSTPEEVQLIKHQTSTSPCLKTQRQQPTTTRVQKK